MVRPWAVQLMPLIGFVWIFGVGNTFASDRGGPAATGEFAVKGATQAPRVVWEAKAGFRDWGRLGYVDGLILAGHTNDDGGLRAIDAQTGKIRWLAAKDEHVWATPVSDGKVIVVPVASSNQVDGYSLSGKQLWRIKKDLVKAAEPTIADGVVYLQEVSGNLSAVDVESGKERWRFAFSRGGDCAARPLVADGVVYFVGSEGGKYDPWGHYYFWAVDAKSGQQLWRYQVKPSRGSVIGYCLRQPLLVGDTIYVAGGYQMLALDRRSGEARWAVEVEAKIDGNAGFDQVHNLIYAEGLLYGMTPRYLAAFDPQTGHATWRLPGKFSDSSPSMAIARGVLYFQGAPNGSAATRDRGTLHALDLATKQILWSYSYPKKPDWSFDDIQPVDGGVIVNTYGAVLRLQSP